MSKLHKLYISLDDLSFIRLKQLAGDETMAKIAGRCLAAYLQERADVGEIVARVDGTIAAPEPMIKGMLAGVEQRLTATIDGQSQRNVEVTQEMKRLSVMIEKAMLSYLQHTPEVPETRKGQAAESGQQRFDKWKASVNIAVKEIKK